MSVKIETEVFGLDQVRRKIGRLSTFDMSDLLDNVGALVESQTKTRIKNEKESPSGQPWEELSEPYLSWKAKKKPGVGLLEFEGHLFESITHNVIGDTVEIGTNLVYGRTHQEGRDGIPAREFLGLSERDKDEVEDLVAEWLEDRMKA